MATINKLKLARRVPCVQGEYAPWLLTYTTQLSPSDLREILGHDPRSRNWPNLLPLKLRKIYQTLQRETDEDRSDSIGRYLIDRIGPLANYIGGFPGISIAVLNPTPFHPYNAADDEASALGYLSFDTKNTNLRIVIDGLSRVTVAMDTVEDAQDDKSPTQERSKNIVESFTLPVTFFVPTPEHAENFFDKAGQLFHDFNFRVTPVKRELALALDQSDAYTRLTNELGEKCKAIKDAGGMLMREKTVPSNSSEFVTQVSLYRMVRGAMEGHAFQESNLKEVDKPNLTKATFDANLGALVEYINQLAAAMGGNRFEDQKSLHLSAPGLQTIGVIFHDMYHRLHLNADTRAEMVVRLAAIDWTRNNPDWVSVGLLAKAYNKKKGVSTLKIGGAGRSNRAAALAYVRDKLGLTPLLDQLDLGLLATVPAAPPAAAPAPVAPAPAFVPPPASSPAPPPPA